MFTHGERQLRRTKKIPRVVMFDTRALLGVFHVSLWNSNMLSCCAAQYPVTGTGTGTGYVQYRVSRVFPDSPRCLFTGVFLPVPGT